MTYHNAHCNHMQMDMDECPCGATLKSSLELEFDSIFSNLSKVQDLCQRLDFLLKDISTVTGR